MPGNAQHTIQTDTALIREWQQSGDHNYLDEVVERDSATMETTQVLPKANTPSTSFSIPSLAVWCCIGALVLVLLFFAIRSGWFKGSSKKKSKTKDVEKKKKEDEANETAETAINQEEFFGFDFQTLTAEALAEKDYAAALRYTYMQAFRQICEAGFLTWRQDTTPSEYATLVTDAAAEPFRRITAAYVRAQYGHYEVTEDNYAAAKADFEELNNHVNAITAERRRKAQEEAEEAERTAREKGGEA